MHNPDSSSLSTESSSHDHRDKRQKCFHPDEAIDEQINTRWEISSWRDECGGTLFLEYFFLFLVIILETSNQTKVNITDLTEIYMVNREELIEKLRNAWDSKSYREVLKLDYLQPFLNVNRPSLPHHPEIHPDPQEKGKIIHELKKAWKQPFNGDYHRVLLKNINEMYQAEPYQNICGIVQSSGTGKSRMVDEQAKLVYTLPINIRHDEKLSVSYPPSDDILYQYLVDQAPWDMDECKTHYTTFLRYTFSHARSELSTLSANNNDLITKWYDRMADATYRNKFYEDVVSLCKSDTAGLNASDELDRLITELNKLCTTENRIKVVIYIDEAHELRKDRRRRAQLDIMCSVVSKLSTFPLFLLLLSTQSCLRFFAPTGKAAASERARLPGTLAPITETPFDCSPNLTVNPGALHLTDLSTINYVAMWGRPLWWTMSAGWNTDAGEIRRLVNFARMKLMCTHAINRDYREFPPIALIAVLDVLLTFDFEPDRTFFGNYETDLVKSHMRIAYSVPQHHTHFQSGYPSEPLLAEAAAQQLQYFKTSEPRTNGLDIIINILHITSLFCGDLIDLGQRGEVTMRILLMRAYMDAVLKDHAENPGDFFFCRGCKLITFINELFESEYANKILEGVPDILKDDTSFRQAFEHSVVRFTHFVKAGDEYEFTSEALFAAFARGVAFIGSQTQRYVDFAIPVLLHEKEALQESAMSAILIQVKRRVTAETPTRYVFREEQINLFPSNGDTKLLRKRPYIVLVAELGVNPKEGKVKEIKTPSVHILQQPDVQHHVPDIHPRYAIVSYGSSGVYRYFAPHQRALLLATHDYLAEHPRKDVESLNLAMRLKPIWEHGENTYHWVNTSALRKP